MAALLVFLFHFPVWGLGWVADVVMREGHVGVTVFFVLSGFLITVRYFPETERGDLRAGDYFVRRVARILPLYVVVLTLTHVLGSGGVPLDASRVPEWTLTQGLFDPTPEALTIPTSWSLTVEECYYASAPLLFLALRAARRRMGAAAGGATALLLCGLAFHLAGTLVRELAEGSRLRFLGDEGLLRAYTIFGRFPEFALGTAAGLLFLSGRVDAAWRRRRGALLATAVAACGAALLVAAQAGMSRDAGDALAVWKWNVVAAMGAASGIVALTCHAAPLTRALSIAPAVYAGRISYALYLVQLTPLGKGLLFPLLPSHDLAHVALLYLGMSLVSAALFELVEEPARETILAAWRGRGLGAPAGGARGWVPALVLGAAILVQYATWAVAGMPPVDEARVERVLGPGSPDVLRADVAADPADGREPRIRLPDAWKVGPASDPRVPPALLVFADGRPVPFLGVRDPTDPSPSAYYRRARADSLSVQLDSDARVTVVNRSPPAVLALAWSRLREAPIVAAFPAALAAVVLALAFRRPTAPPWRPQAALAVGVALTVAWLVTGLYRRSLAPVALLAEVGLLVPAAGRRPR